MSLADANGDIDFLFNGYIPPRVPEGEYDLGFVRAEKKYMFGKGQRLFLWFRILSPGQWYGTELYMTCTVAPNGKWGTSHKFYLAWVLAAGRRPNRRDRVSTNEFREKLFYGKVRIVRKTSRQTQRTTEQQYSVIDDLLAVIVGGACQDSA